MAEENVNRYVNTIFTASDQLSPAHQRLQAQAQRTANVHSRALAGVWRGFTAPARAAANVVTGTVGGAVNAVRSRIGMLGVGLSAAFAARGIFEGTRDAMAHVDRLTRLTDMTAESASAWVDVLETAGVATEAVDRTFFSLSRRAAMVEMGGRGANRQWQALGIDLRRGPEAALMRMSELAHAGRLSAGQLAMTLRSTPETASRLLGVLERGPAAITQGLHEAGQYGAIVQTRTLLLYRQMQQNQREISDSWGDMRLILGQQFLPLVAGAMRSVNAMLSRMIPHAQRFGQILARGASYFHFAMTMAFRAASGVVGRITAGLGALRRSATGRRVEAGVRSAVDRAPQMLANLPIIRMVTSFFTSITRSGMSVSTIFSYISSIGSAVWPVLQRVGVFAATVGSALGRLAGAVLPSVFRGLSVLIESIAPVVSTFVTGVTRIIQRIEPPIAAIVVRVGTVFETLSGVVSRLMPVIQTVLGAGLEALGWTLQNVVLPVMNFFSSVLQRLSDAIMWLVDHIPGLNRVGMTNVAQGGIRAAAGLSTPSAADIARARAMAPPGLMDTVRSAFRAWEETQKREMEGLNARRRASGTPGQRPATGTVNDFRGSRFDITQSFAEGFDPDRIAVAFANDLAALGERRIQSAYSPIYGVR